MHDVCHCTQSLCCTNPEFKNKFTVTALILLYSCAAFGPNGCVALLLFSFSNCCLQWLDRWVDETDRYSVVQQFIHSVSSILMSTPIRIHFVWNQSAGRAVGVRRSQIRQPQIFRFADSCNFSMLSLYSYTNYIVVIQCIAFVTCDFSYVCLFSRIRFSAHCFLASPINIALAM